MTTLLRTIRRRLALGTLTAAIALVSAPEAATQETFRARRVWKGTPEPFCCGNTLVSRDGRYVPGWDSDTGNLQYLDLLENRWVKVIDKGTWDTSDSFSLNPMFSPDGEWIAHTWTEGWERGIRLDRRDGSEHRIVYEGDTAAPLAWTPDGSGVLLVVRTLDPTRLRPLNPARAEGGWDRLVLVPADGGEPTVLKEITLVGPVDGRLALTATSSGLAAAAFSPDGRWLAYQRFKDGTRISDLHMLSADGTTDRPLVTDDVADRLLGWAPDGSAVLFHSEREARPGIWRVAVTEGAPVGDPTFVQDDVWGMEPMGLSSRGLHYSIVTERPQIQTFDVDFERAEIVSAASPVRDPGSESMSHSPTWSPDGRQLAYLTDFQEVEVRSLETGEVRTYPLDRVGAQKIAWGSDPLTIVFSGNHEELGRGVFRLDLQSGEVRPVMAEDDAPSNLEDTFKRDGRTLAVPLRGEDGGVNYRVHDLETGHEMVIATGAWSWIRAFPGGDRYAVWTEKGPRDGGPVDVTLAEYGLDGSQRVIWEGTVQERFMQTMAITSDGRYILVAIEGKVGIISTDTGDLRMLRTSTGEDFEGSASAMAIQPNGSRIASNGGSQAMAEIWVIEGIR